MNNEVIFPFSYNILSPDLSLLFQHSVCYDSSWTGHEWYAYDENKSIRVIDRLFNLEQMYKEFPHHRYSRNIY